MFLLLKDHTDMFSAAALRRGDRSQGPPDLSLARYLVLGLGCMKAMSTFGAPRGKRERGLRPAGAEGGKGGCDGFHPGLCRDWCPSTPYPCHLSFCTRLLEGWATAVTHSERPVAPHTYTHIRTHYCRGRGGAILTLYTHI